MPPLCHDGENARSFADLAAVPPMAMTALRVRAQPVYANGLGVLPRLLPK
jgi:hypothetical protein